MAIVVKDRVKQSAAAPGTGTITLGAVASGFQGFSAIGNGNVTYFAITDVASGAWEVNYGTYTSSGTTLSRNATPLSSSNAGALVNFTGTVDVFCTYPSSKAIYEETSGNVLIDGGPITVVGTGVTSYTTFGAALAELYANLNSFAQFYAQNLNGGASASTDIVAYNNLGDGTNNFIDMGISSSNYTEAAYPIFTPASGYVYNDGGELIIGTATATKDVLLFAGGVAATDWAARISGTNQSITTKAGLTVGGAFTSTGAATFSSTVLLNANPTLNLQAATKQYVDSAVSTGFTVQPSVVYSTAAALPANTYNNGTAGVGATLTATANGALSVDGNAVTTSQRILVKDEAAQANNGCYTVTATGSAGAPYVLTRATNFDTATAGEISNNAYFFTTAGATNAGSAFILSQTAAITVGTTALPFTLFSDQLNYVGGTNIDVTGLTISLTGTVAPTNGGTGVNTVTTGDLLYGSATNTWGKLPKGAAYRSLIMDASATNVEWNAVALNQSNAVSGTLGATNGGTSFSSYTLGDIIYSSASNTLAKLAGNTTTTKKFLVQTGTGAASAAPAWDVVNGADVNGNITGQAGSVANALTAGTYLTSGGTYNGSVARTFTVDATSANTASKVVARDVSGNFSAGTITAALSGNATTATTATNVAGGTANQIVYNTSAGTTNFAAAPSASGQLLGWNGSAYAWVSPVPVTSGGTGLTSLTAGYIPFGAGTSAFGNSANLFWDNTNARLGIGTSSPANKLTVAVPGNATLNTPAAYAAIFNSNDAVNNQYYGLAFTNSNTAEGATQKPQALISCIASGGSWSSNWAGDLVFATASGGANAAPTEKVRIRSDGNLGIGTSSPSVASGSGVVIYSSAVARLTLKNSTTGDTSTDGVGLFVSGSDLGIENREAGNIIFYNTSEKMRLDSSGNLGIGTASPAQRLDIRGNTGSNIGQVIKNDGAGRAILELDAGGTSTTFIQFKNQGTATALVQSDNSSNLTFATGSSNTERFRIGSAGQLGIGGANYGTAGQVLTSAGSGAAPTWSTSTAAAKGFAVGMSLVFGR